MSEFIPHFVIWEDACSLDEWTDTKDVKENPRTIIHSVGFLIEKTTERLVLALNHDPANSSLSCIMYIPINMVKAIIPLDK